MPSLIEKLAFPGPPKYNKNKSNFTAVPLSVPSLKVNISLDIMEPPSTLTQLPYTIIYSHGNAEHLYNQHMFLEDFSKILQCRIISYDYLGYGTNEGKPTEKSCYVLIQAVYDYVKEKYPNDTIISWGRSIGSAPAIDLAIKNPDVKYVIIQSGLSSGLQVIFKNGCACIDQFLNYKKIIKIKSKILIMHGSEDEVVPYRCSLKNFNEYINHNHKGKPIISYYSTKNQNRVMQIENITHVSIHGAGHNDVDTAYEEVVVDEVKNFLGSDFDLCSSANKSIKDPRSIKNNTRDCIMVID